MRTAASRISVFLSGLFAVIGTCAAQQPLRAVPADYPGLVRYLFHADRLWTPPLPGEGCVQFSSYDRRSDAGPGDAEAWYANGDRGQFLRTEKREGRTEHVLVDCEGPGVVVRIWSANPSGTLRFYFDGVDVPRWSVPFADMTGGKKKPFVEPWSGVRARGANCHVPVPFGKRLVITCDRGDFYYQVQVRRFAKGTKLVEFWPSVLDELPEVAGFGWLATMHGTEPVDGGVASLGLVEQSEMPHPFMGLSQEEIPEGARPTRGLEEFVLTRRQSCRALFEVTHDLVVRELNLAVGGWEERKSRDLLRALRLRIRTPEEVLVDAPVLDLFCYLPDDARPRVELLFFDGLPLPFGPFLSLHWPMPLPAGSRIELVQDPSILAEDERVKMGFGWVVGYQDLPEDALFFRADWNGQRGVRTRPFSAHRVLDARGTGRLVGCTLHVANPERPWWGEGDEKIWVDGESFPSTFGTGTEDYFGYAWCSPALFQHPLHAQVHCDGPGNFGHTLVHRTQLLTDIPFRRKLRFDFEVWYGHDEPVDLDYATTVFWYGAAGARSGLPPLPRAGERLLRSFPPRDVLNVEGAIEAESLRPLQPPPGRVRSQNMARYLGVRWSGDAQLWWTHAKPGDALELAVPVAEAGRYELRVRYTKANDYAVVAASLGGLRCARPIDLYAEKVVPTKELSLGVHELPAGTVNMRFEILGKNGKARPGYLFGLDYVRLIAR